MKIYNQEGRLLAYVGDHGNYPGQFMAAFGVAIDKQNRVITSEQWPGRLQVFRYVTEAEAAEAAKEQATPVKQEEEPKKAAPAARKAQLTQKESAKS